MTTSKYLITQSILGHSEQVEISKEDFHRIQSAYATLQNVIAAEEQFDAVARNFFDLEADLLAITLEFTYGTLADGMKNMAARRQLNRRLLNFLSAARGYMDHQRHVVKEIFDPSDPRSEEAIRMFRVAHSGNFGYRLMEELRNACQHRIFPIHAIVFNTKNEREKGTLHSRVEIHVNVDELSADKKFKQAVLDELRTYGKTVDLRPSVRIYIEGIAKAHQYFRDNVGELTEGARNLLEQSIERYLSSGRDVSTIGLHAVEVTENVWGDKVPLSSGLPEYEEYLARQNVHFEMASVKYVSSSVFQRDGQER